MTATATKTHMTIEFYTGNMICGCDQETIDSINFDATVADFCKRVENRLSEYDVEWRLVKAEGPGMRAIGADVTAQMEEDLMEADAYIFNLGEFWINN